MLQAKRDYAWVRYTFTAIVEKTLDDTKLRCDHFRLENAYKVTC